MEGIVKSAPKPESRKVVEPTQTTSGIDSTKPHIHTEFMAYFNADKGSEQLKYIHDWAVGNAENVGKALKLVKDAEIRLGVPSQGETRIGKLYNYLRMANRQNQVGRELEQELESIRAKNLRTMEEIDSMFDGKREKIVDEWNRAKKEYFKARAKFNREASAKAMAVRNTYKNQLDELSAMLEAFGGHSGND